MSSVLLAIILDALTFYVAMIYGSNSFALLGFAEAVFFVFSFSYLIRKRVRSRYILEVPVTMAEQGQKLIARVRVAGMAMADPSQLNCRVELQSRQTKRRHGKKQLVRRTDSEHKNCCVYEIVCDRPGRYDVMLQSVVIHDVTGLIHMKKKTKQRIAIDVLPIFAQIPIRLTEPVLHFVGDADVYDENRPGHDSSETLQYRPFQEGDKIQRIHWKLSARSDELIVKESSLPRACPMTLQLEHGNGDYLKVAASLSFSILDAGCPHYVSWYSEREQDVVRVRVDDEESLYEFLLRYMQDTEPKLKVDIRKAYQEKYTADLVIHRLYLDENLSFYQNDELVSQLDRKKLDQSLNSMEVIL